ncbi:MAG: hypothetical protein AAFR61_19795 [Bacteroidota bacterium]
MKRFTLILFLAGLLLHVHAQHPIKDPNFFPEVYVFADRVNLRYLPDLSSRVVATVPEGTVLHEIANWGKDTINGKVGLWKKVYYRDEIVFVWSRLLAKAVIQSQTDPTVRFMLGRGAGLREGSIKAFRNGKKYATHAFQTSRDLQTVYELETYGSQGLSGIKDILSFISYGSACGQRTDHFYFAWDGENIHPFITTYGIPDGEYFDYTEVILPYDSGGKAGKVQVALRQGEMLHTSQKVEDPRSSPEIRYTVHSLLTYQWKQHKLVRIE